MRDYGKLYALDVYVLHCLSHAALQMLWLLTWTMMLLQVGTMQGLEGREPIVLVVDDTSSVWGNHEENLVAVERYIYFPASRRQFGSKSKALLELRRDETPQSGMLMTALNVLLRTHRRTFTVLRDSGGIEAAGYKVGERPRWDVRQILQDERKQVMLGSACILCVADV